MEVSPNSTTEPLNMYDYINSYFMNPIAFTLVILTIIIIIVVYVSLGGNSSQQGVPVFTTDSTMKIYGIIGVGLFIVLILINGLQYFYGNNIYASIKNLFYGVPEVNIKIVPDQQVNATDVTIPEIKVVNQVFNVPGNYYGYNDAKALCSAYGARLATYEEIESSYNEGAEWCNYGWSDEQMALFPTQKSTYDNLQKIPGHSHDCGRPGINGGYIANPLVKFGVNCYGHKPKINQEEQHLMDVTTPYPKTEKDLLMEQRIAYWKNKLDEILVSPFNYKSWSKI